MVSKDLPQNSTNIIGQVTFFYYLFIYISLKPNVAPIYVDRSRRPGVDECGRSAVDGCGDASGECTSPHPRCHHVTFREIHSGRWGRQVLRTRGEMFGVSARLSGCALPVAAQLRHIQQVRRLIPATHEKHQLISFFICHSSVFIHLVLLLKTFIFTLVWLHVHVALVFQAAKLYTNRHCY